MTRRDMLASLACASVANLRAQSADAFHDPLVGKLHPSWTWVREQKDAWKIDGSGLHLRVLVGTLWGKDNTAGNFPVRPAPAAPQFATEVTVTTVPELPNEQAGLIWYAGDDDYLKLVKENKEQPYIILAREEKQAAKTMGRIAMPRETVVLRLSRTDAGILAQARTPSGEWQDVGKCPALMGSAALQTGVCANVTAGETNRWARFNDFRVTA